MEISPRPSFPLEARVCGWFFEADGVGDVVVRVGTGRDLSLQVWWADMGWAGYEVDGVMC